MREWPCNAQGQRITWISKDLTCMQDIEGIGETVAFLVGKCSHWSHGEENLATALPPLEARVPDQDLLLSKLG